MVKRERLTSSEDECKAWMDRMSELPNEVLGLILSFLRLKEATATSILSRRWKHVWRLIPRLDLDGAESLWKARNKEAELEEERSKYITWVDQTLSQSQSQSSTSLDEFRVFFDLTTSHGEHIDQWLQHALSRKVQRLELNLTDIGSRCSRRDYERYIFPYKEGNFPNNFKFIKKLSTHYVNVSGEAVEFFLGNCPLLEQVSVSGSSQLESLQIITTFPSFKCLEISLCFNLDSVVIRDSNVVSIKYRGKRVKRFLLVNVPLLTEICIGGVLSKRTKHVVEMFAAVLPQLQVLKMGYLYKGLSWKESRNFWSAVQMSNLKQLVVNIGVLYNDRDSLLPVIYLIRASPCLQRFVLEVPVPHKSNENENDEFFACARARALARARKKIGDEYPHLREIEFVGYRGVDSHFEVIKHFVENGVALKNIVVDPRGFKCQLDRPWDRISPRTIFDGEVFARARAKDQLQEYVPSTINVKIL